MEEVKQHNDPIVYTARGKVCGVYQPDPKNFLQGTLQTEDGMEIPAQVTEALAEKLQSHPDFLKLPLVWKCYPSIDPPLFTLVRLKWREPDVPNLGRRRINKFRVVGQVAKVEDQSVTVLLKRNKPPEEGQKESFTLTIQGEVPKEAVGQFWRFTVRRESWDWNIITAKPVPNIEQPKTTGSSSEKVKSTATKPTSAQPEKTPASISKEVKSTTAKTSASSAEKVKKTTAKPASQEQPKTPTPVPEKVKPATIKPAATTTFKINAPGQELTQADLARRLGVSSSTIGKRKSKPDFRQWSIDKDPDSIPWRYDEKTKRFSPTS
ncbi:MAG: hypothetical protein WA919_26660 [Coleofasciculaceae cyanobacterium]